MSPAAAIATGRSRGLDRRGASAWPSSASARSPCRASRSGARTTSITRTTTCRCSTRCGRRSRTRTCRSPSTSRPGAIRAPSRGNGGAVINYVSHSLSPTIEPVANLCASGVLRALPAAALRHDRGRASAGWPGCSTPWTRPTASTTSGCGRSSAQLPSEYFREHGFASFQEDPAGLALAEPMNLADNFMWGNDYPHHEGTWPHSAEAIERTMGHLSDGRAGQGARPQRRAPLRLRGAAG